VAFAGKALLLCGLAALLAAERRFPLRQSREPGFRRILRNVATGAITALVVSTIERPIVSRVSKLADERAWGIVPKLPCSEPVRKIIALALMDYSLYWWHVLLHRVPALWRTHEPHHIDRDLDTSTAVRFHFAEFVASIPWRCAQIVAIGVAPLTLQLWQRLTLAEVLFHHSNLRLPRGLERVLSAIVVTPRLHGVHHSILTQERDSNFSSGLTIWDRLHGSARFGLDRDGVTIGAPEYQNERDVTFVKTLALPLKHDRME
jgi:sterol desaturase/sphingolipid hydroxylase (fatty acid hydroxylase superfamily)